MQTNWSVLFEDVYMAILPLFYPPKMYHYKYQIAVLRIPRMPIFRHHLFFQSLFVYNSPTHPFLKKMKPHSGPDIDKILMRHDNVDGPEPGDQF